MEKTELLYLNDSYAKEFVGEVISVKKFNNNILIRLNRTLFYPGGGGQPNDIGTLEKGKEIYRVLEVYKYNNEIFHVVEKEGLQEGDKIKGIIDWERRYKLMRMHTAAHLLSAIICEKENAKITGNQLGLERSRIDFNVREFKKEKIMHYIDEANRLIQEGRNVKIYTMKGEEIKEIDKLVRLAKGLPENLKEIRIVGNRRD